jgi:excisionase family DNA binding protein
MAIDLAGELVEAFRRPEVRDFFRDLVADAVRQELPNVTQGDPDQLLGADMAATLLGMSVGAVRKAAARGTIKSVRVGRRLRFRRGDLLSKDRKSGVRRAGPKRLLAG